MRPSKRSPDELRPVSIDRAVSMHAEGSCLIKFGHTHVHCTASLEERLPPWLKGQGGGWVTAEYGMLPRATNEPHAPRGDQGKQSGRTQEIQRLIGRSLRAVVDLPKLGERQISIDCDVIQADGGTRTAAITGGLGGSARLPRVDADARHDQGWRPARSRGGGVLRHLRGNAVLDLDYPEDSDADADANFVHDRLGRHRRSSRHGGKSALFSGKVRPADGPGEEGCRGAGLTAEADGDMTT